MFDLLSHLNVSLEGSLISEKSMVTSGPLKEHIETENGVRPDLHFVIDYQFQPRKLIDLWGFLFLRLHTGKSKCYCHTLCKRTMNEV